MRAPQIARERLRRTDTTHTKRGGSRAVIVPRCPWQRRASRPAAHHGILVTRTSTAPVVAGVFPGPALSRGRQGYLSGHRRLVTDQPRTARRERRPQSAFQANVSWSAPGGGRVPFRLGGAHVGYLLDGRSSPDRCWRAQDLSRGLAGQAPAPRERARRIVLYTTLDVKLERGRLTSLGPCSDGSRDRLREARREVGEPHGSRRRTDHKARVSFDDIGGLAHERTIGAGSRTRSPARGSISSGGSGRPKGVCAVRAAGHRGNRRVRPAAGDLRGWRYSTTVKPST